MAEAPAAPAPALDWAPPPRGGLTRAIVMLPLAFLTAFLIASALMMLFLVAPSSMRRHQTRWVQAWGKSILFLFGVKVEVHGAEHRAAPGPARILFNHVSLLDMMVLATLWSPDATLVYKKEFHRIPVIGRVMRRLGMIAIDRGQRELAVASLAEAAALVRARQCKVFLSPEGTRSRRGGLQDFKLGPFHLAIATGAPIVPAIQRGIDALNPHGSWLIRSGTVRVDYLEPVRTAGWREETVREHAAAVRAIFLRHLPPAPAA